MSSLKDNVNNIFWFSNCRLFAYLNGTDNKNIHEHEKAEGKRKKKPLLMQAGPLFPFLTMKTLNYESPYVLLSHCLPSDKGSQEK